MPPVGPKRSSDLPTSRRHYRITLGDAIGAHERAIAKFGGRPGIQDLGLVEAAIGRPYTGYYRPIYRKAAALVHSVATNHGFVDGNKRTALILLELFLERSGFEVRETSTSPDSDDIEHLILDMTTRFLTFEEVTYWLKMRIRPVK